MNDHRIKDNHDLQAYFTKQVQRIVAKHGKHAEGWDEVLGADLPKDVLIQSWQGQKPLAEAARQGYSGILSAGYYLDHMEPGSTRLPGGSARRTKQPSSRRKKNRASWEAKFACGANTSAPKMSIPASGRARPPSPNDFGRRRRSRDIASMYRRVDAVSPKLEWVGLTHISSYLPMLRRMAGDQSIDAFKVLADVVQPANQDARDEANNTQQTPLNRLVDAARSKSKTARDFRALVEKWIALRSAPG